MGLGIWDGDGAQFCRPRDWKCWAGRGSASRIASKVGCRRRFFCRRWSKGDGWGR